MEIGHKYLIKSSSVIMEVIVLEKSKKYIKLRFIYSENKFENRWVRHGKEGLYDYAILEELPILEDKQKLLLANKEITINDIPLELFKQITEATTIISMRLIMNDYFLDLGSEEYSKELYEGVKDYINNSKLKADNVTV